MPRRAHRISARSLMVGALTAVACIGGGLPAHADTGPVTGGTIVVPDKILANDRCVEVPVSYDYRTLPVQDNWSLDLNTTASIGAIAFGNGGTTGIADATWCPSDGLGAFTLSGTSQVFDNTGAYVATDVVNLTFTIVKRTTRASLSIKPTRPKIRKTNVTFKGCITAAGEREPGRSMILQYRIAKKSWRTFATIVANDQGCWKGHKRAAKAQTTYFRVRVPATSSRTAAYSRTVKVKAHK